MLMMLFPQKFVIFIIIGALIATAIAAVALIGMFINDARKKQIW